jgi:LuxR family maltose regulon positive regulatory protein
MAARSASLPPVGRVALDAGDNDPLRFWRYLIAAYQVFQKDLGSTVLTQFRDVQQPLFLRRSQEAMLTALLNELARLPGRGILVLEDYHVITTPEIHEAMSFFLEHLPATLHLILVTRIDPPLPLARLRAQIIICTTTRANLRMNRDIESEGGVLHSVRDPFSVMRACNRAMKRGKMLGRNSHQ